MSNDLERQRAIYYRYVDQHYGADPLPEIDEAWLLVNEPFPSNPLNINRVLREEGRGFAGKALSGDIDGLRTIIRGTIDRMAEESQEELEKARIEMEVVLDRLEELHREFVADILTVDLVVSDFPKITRDGLTLVVRGSLAIYEIDLMQGQVSAYCRMHHQAGEFICTNADGGLHEVGESDIRHGRIRKALQKAICLSNDLDLSDETVYDSLRRVVMCPWCHMEGEIQDESVRVLAEKLACMKSASRLERCTDRHH